MHGIHSYYDIGVAIVDCIIVIVYIRMYIVCLGSFRSSVVFYSTLGYQEKVSFSNVQMFKTYVHVN